MSILRVWSRGTAVLLLGLWPKTLPPAEPKPDPSNAEPLVVHGTPGHSVVHALVELREIAAQAAATAEGGEEARPERMPENEPPWKDLSLPLGARVLREDRRTLPQAAMVVRVPSPPLASSFQALLDDGRVIPPDTGGAVGPNHIVTMLNSQVRVHDRSGRELATMTLSSFWTGVAAELRVSDPRIEYDPSTDRWIASAIAFSNAVKDSSVLVGASTTGDPTRAWNLYRVRADPDTSLLFADFPTLGFSKDWIAVQVNMYGFVPTDPVTSVQQLVRTQIYAFDKRSILEGDSDARHTRFAREGLGSSQVPAVTYDAELPVLYLLETWNGNLGGTGYLRLYSISGPVGSEILSSIGFPATDEPWDFAPRGNGDFGPQKDAPVNGRTRLPEYVQTGNSDFSHVVFRNGLLTASHTIFLPPGGSPTRSAVQWWQLTADGSVVQRGRLDDPTGQIFYAYSSAAPNRENDLLLGYATYSLQQYPSAGYSFRSAGDPPGALREGEMLKSGENWYVKTFGGSRNRWGDYSLTAVDPVNDHDLWTIQEYATVPPQPSPVSWWGTWWGRVVPEPGSPVPLPVASFSSSATATSAGQTVAFTDTSAGATRWFWNFGDGTDSTERNPIHVFQFDGSFTVVLNALNQTGASTATRSITVAPPARLLPQPVPRDRSPGRVTPRS